MRWIADFRSKWCAIGGRSKRGDRFSSAWQTRLEVKFKINASPWSRGARSCSGEGRAAPLELRVTSPKAITSESPNPHDTTSRSSDRSPALCLRTTSSAHAGADGDKSVFLNTAYSDLYIDRNYVEPHIPTPPVCDMDIRRRAGILLIAGLDQD
jgi:hypothetical protein